jgi:hypothetical protein
MNLPTVEHTMEFAPSFFAFKAMLADEPPKNCK